MLKPGFTVRAHPARIGGALRELFQRLTCYGYIERFASCEFLTPGSAFVTSVTVEAKELTHGARNDSNV